MSESQNNFTVPKPAEQVQPAQLACCSRMTAFLRRKTVLDLIDQRLPGKLKSSIEEFKDIKTDVNQFGRQIYDLENHVPISDVLKLMQEKRITKVPIYERKASGFKTYIAIVSILDVLHYVCFQDITSDLTKYHEDIFEAKDEKRREEFEAFIAKAATLFDRDVSLLIGQNAESLEASFAKTTDNLEEVLRAFKGRHEVIVSDPAHEGEDMYMTMLTQTDVIWYIWNNAKEIDDHQCFDTKVDKVLLCARSKQSDVDPNQILRPGYTVRPVSFVLTADKDFSALVCFRKMRIHRVTSVGLIDKAGKLVGNISASDFVKMSGQGLIDLCLPAVEFLKKYGTEVHVISVSPRDTFLKAMEVAVNSQIHHVYLTDEDGKPTGILTMSDMLDFISI